MRIARRAKAPAKVSSESPSGKGITAARIIAGVPPTNTFTGNRSPRLNRRRVMHADAAMDLIVQPDLPIGRVLAARNLHAVHAQVGIQQARLVGMLGVNFRQRDERPAVARPTDNLRELVDRGLMPKDRTPPALSRQHGEQASRNVPVLPGIFPKRRGIDLQFHQMPDSVRRHRETKTASARGCRTDCSPAEIGSP